MHTRIRRIRNRWRSRRLLRLQRFTRDESGLQLVELTIVIPIFLMLLAATAEFGRYFYEYTTLAKATRVGSRYLSVEPRLPSPDTAAKNIVVYGNAAGTGSPILTDLDPSHVVITPKGENPLSPETITVEIVGYEHQPIFDIGALTGVVGLSTKVDVKPSVTMRFLGGPPPLSGE